MNDDVVFRRVEWGQRSIDTSQVPVSLHGLIPFAELLGEHGHMNVELALDRLSQDEREVLENTLRRNRDALAKWLDEACDSVRCFAFFGQVVSLFWMSEGAQSDVKEASEVNA